MNRIKKARLAAGLSQKKVAETLGVSAPTVSEWESGKKFPAGKNLLELSRLLSCSTDYLLGQSNDPSMRAKPFRRIPVLGSVPAGIPIEAIHDEVDWEELGEEYLDTGFDYIGLLIKGDSMLPEYRNGDVVIIRVQADADSGDDAVVFVNSDDATFKRFSRTEKGITLRPLNPDYEPMFFTPREVHALPVQVFGIAVEVRRKIRK